MSEKEIAERKVVPYLEKMGWPKQLITQYGRVPVQMGTDVKFADIVALLVDEDEIAFPYLVIEVKTNLKDFGETLAQAESYSKFLNAMIFGITDGEKYFFYQTRPSGGYLKIRSVPIPEETHLTVTEQTKIKPAFIMCAEHYSVPSSIRNQYADLESKIDDFFSLLVNDRFYMGKSHSYSLRRDITAHYLRTKALKSIFSGESGSLKAEDFKNVFSDYVMCYKQPNINKIFDEVDHNFEKVKQFMKYIKDFSGDPQTNLSHLFDPDDELHVRGMGPFVVSQFLSGAHPKDYSVIEDRMVDTLKKFNLIDVKVRSNTSSGYLYINTICKKLLKDIFEGKIQENKAKIGFDIDEDFGLVVLHEFFWEYDEFNSYIKTDIERAAAEEREIEEETTNQNLREIDLLGV